MNIYQKGVLLIGFFALLFSSGCIFPGQQSNNVTIVNLTFSIATGSNPMLGNASAPITIVEFTDYQCPYCKRHADETFPLIKTNYVDTGKVKYYIRDYLIHGNSESAALAARCAGEQGKYWEMHSILFTNQADWETLSGNNLGAKFGEYVSSLGINTATFSSCYTSDKYGQTIAADMSAGQSYGVTGTPSSIVILPKTVNETKLLNVLSSNSAYVAHGLMALGRDPNGNYIFFLKGAFPYDTFKAVLDS